MSYRVTMNSEFTPKSYWGNIGLGNFEPLATAFSSTHQYPALFYGGGLTAPPSTCVFYKPFHSYLALRKLDRLYLSAMLPGHFA